MTINSRPVHSILPGAPFHMVGDGFRVRNYLPFNDHSGQQMSPFFLLDYHPPFVYPPTSNERRGVGPHPHRGLETVTIAFSGSVAHHDSAGNSGVIGPGDVQWMTAGSGILHKEYHERMFAQAGGELHMLQLWTNLPRAHKMTQPKYQSILSDQMGKVILNQADSHVKVIAGSYQGVRGPAATFSPIDLLIVHLQAGGVFTFNPSDTVNVGLLIVQGQGKLGSGESVKAEDLVVFTPAAGCVKLQCEPLATDPCIAVLMSGEPLHEPVAHYGPFLMNNKQELVQAMDDFNRGKFGVLGD